MSRHRPDHSSDMLDRGERSRLRSRRRRRRAVRGLVQTLFWTLVLAGVFVLGLGYGRTLAGDDETRRDDVTITSDLGPVEATLPTRTVTVVKTVTTPARTDPRVPAVSPAQPR